MDRSRNRLIALLAVACTVVVPRATFGDEAQTILWERFRSEYPIAATKLKQATANLRCRAHLIREGYESRMTYFVNGECKQAIFEYDPEQRLAEQPDVAVYCLTPHYAFRLEKARGADDYVVREMDEDAGNSGKSFMLNRMDVFLSAAFQAYHHSVETIIADPTFKLLDISSRTAQGRESVEMRYLMNWEIWGVPYDLELGRMVFIPDLNWALCEWEIVIVDPAAEHPSREQLLASIEPELWSADNSFVFPKHVSFVVRDYRADGTVHERTDRIEFSEIVPGVVTDEQFKLSAYGISDTLLPHSELETGFRFDWPYRGLVLAVAFSLVLCWFLIRGQRLDRPRSETT